MRRTNTDRGTRPLGILLTAIGSLLALVGVTVLPWFNVSGPSVVYRLSQIPADPSGTTTVIDPGAGRSHGVVVWGLLVLTVLLAFVAQGPRSGAAWSTVRVLGLIFAALTAMSAVVRLVAVHFVLTATPSLSSATLEISTGFWVTMTGLVLLAGSAAAGPRRRPVRKA